MFTQFVKEEEEEEYEKIDGTRGIKESLDAVKKKTSNFSKESSTSWSVFTLVIVSIKRSISSESR